MAETTVNKLKKIDRKIVMTASNWLKHDSTLKIPTPEHFLYFGPFLRDNESSFVVYSRGREKPEVVKLDHFVGNFALKEIREKKGWYYPAHIGEYVDTEGLDENQIDWHPSEYLFSYGTLIRFNTFKKLGGYYELDKDGVEQAWCKRKLQGENKYSDTEEIDVAEYSTTNWNEERKHFKDSV